MSDEQKITVSKKALQELLYACHGEPHYIRELQATRYLPAGMSDDNCINVLIKQFNEQDNQ